MSFSRNSSLDTFILGDFPEILYTDSSTLESEAILYDNTGIDTGYRVGTIDGNSFILANCSLTIDPDPNNATITLTADGYVQTYNSISVFPKTTVHVLVEAEGYVSTSFDVVVNKTETLSVPLVKLKQIDVENWNTTKSGYTLKLNYYTGTNNNLVLPTLEDM